jgi:hypothetical protein
MRRLSILFSIGLVFALVVVAAAIATAGPDCDNPKFADRPICSEEPGTIPELEACETNMPNVTGGLDCLWTPVNDGTSRGKVLFSDMEGIRSGVVWVLDDFPGDICVLEQGWGSRDGSTFEAEFDLVYGDTLLGYDAWEGRNYWDFAYKADDLSTDPIGAHWCAPQDLASDSIREDTNGTPLHLRVLIKAMKGGHLDITLSPGQAPVVP